jgi:hypothetical protein
VLKLAFAVTLVTIGTTQSFPQTENCSPRERRATAIRVARQINTVEAATFRELGRYQPLSQLAISVADDDYLVQLSTDGVAYAFSIKDRVDPCHGAVFSDQAGIIYTGAPIQ